MLSMRPSTPGTQDNLFYRPKPTSQETPDQSLRESIDAFTKAIKRSRISGTKLLCTIPTCCSSDNCQFDLADLQAQRARMLVLIHGLIKDLQSAGIDAKYSLAPGNSSRCIVCALPPDAHLNQVVISQVEMVNSHKTGCSVVECSTGPCLLVN